MYTLSRQAVRSGDDRGDTSVPFPQSVPFHRKPGCRNLIRNISTLQIMTALRLAQTHIQSSFRSAISARMVHSTAPLYGSSSQNDKAGPSRIPIIRTLQEMREWRRAARDSKLDVGIVPTVCHFLSEVDMC